MPIPDAEFTLAAAKAHLRITWVDEDADITSKLDAAVERCEQFCNRAFCERQYSVLFYTASLHAPLPMARFASEVSFLYRKEGDATITTPMPAASYKILTDVHGMQWVQITSWPDDVDYDGNFAELVYKTVAGGVPANVKAAAHLYLGDLFELRESQIVGTIMVKNPVAEALLAPHRIGWGV